MTKEHGNHPSHRKWRSKVRDHLVRGLMLASLGVAALSTQAKEESFMTPWKVNKPIVEVVKELYHRSPGPRAAAYLWVGYVGPGQVVEEMLTEERQSDQFEKPSRRRSTDNGKTWSAFAPVTDICPYAKDDFLFWSPGSAISYCYDGRHKLLLSMWLRQHFVGGRYYNHTFVRISRDLGLTWGEPKMLRYEAGNDFDLKDPLNPSFLENNGAYIGQKIMRRRDGSLVFPVCSARIPPKAPDPNPRGIGVWDTPANSRNIGSLCFVGKWNRTSKDYDWQAGKPVWLPRHISSRGLMEPDVAELRDGRVLVIWRGSNDGIDASVSPGRKWYSVSSDDGLTLSPVEELKYDDGSRFFSPSSYHFLLRHSVNRKLYWVGNLSPGPTSGNSPRYPLIIAEVDEKIPALKKSTVTVIDDRQPGEPELSLSNFAVLENRETHDLDLYMTRVGDKEGDCVYKYTLKLGRRRT